ncbi:hypothetical protein [Streptomyces chryseus]
MIAVTNLRGQNIQPMEVIGDLAIEDGSQQPLHLILEQPVLANRLQARLTSSSISIPSTDFFTRTAIDITTS